MTRSPGRTPGAGHVLRLDVVHDDAMLGRIVAALGPHPVGAFSYVPEPVAPGDTPRGRHADRARVVVEVTGAPSQVTRVASLLDRLVGVLEVSGHAPPPAR